MQSRIAEINNVTRLQTFTKGGEMAIFKIDYENLHPIQEQNINTEAKIQKITEKNLELIVSLEFVKSEFAIKGRYIDTLAFDGKTKSFVIIEYKKDKSSSVIDQGYAYLSLMLNNRAEFILEYNEIKNQSLKKNDIDWSQSKVIFISREFTPYQKLAIDFKDLPIELWEVKIFQDSLIQYNQLKPLETSVSVKTVTKSKIVDEVSKAIEEYDFEYHAKKTSPVIRDVYKKLKPRINEIGTDVKEVIGKTTIIYKKNYLAFVYFQFRKNEIHGDIRLNNLKKVLKVAKLRNVQAGDPFKVAIKLRSEDDIDSAIELMREAYNEMAAWG